MRMLVIDTSGPALPFKNNAWKLAISKEIANDQDNLDNECVRIESRKLQVEPCHLQDIHKRSLVGTKGGHSIVWRRPWLPCAQQLWHLQRCPCVSPICAEHCLVCTSTSAQSAPFQLPNQVTVLLPCFLPSAWDGMPLLVQ